MLLLESKKYLFPVRCYFDDLSTLFDSVDVNGRRCLNVGYMNNISKQFIKNKYFENVAKHKRNANESDKPNVDSFTTEIKKCSNN